MSELPDIQQIYKIVHWHSNQEPEQHDKPGIFIAIPREIAQQYPESGRTGEDSSPSHITVLIFDAQFNERLEDKVIETVKQICSKMKPFMVEIKPPKAFKKEDGSKVIHSPIKSSRLVKLHDLLKEQLAAALIPVSNKFPDYKPHITIAYQKPGEKSVFADIEPAGQFEVNSLWIWNPGKSPYWIPFNR